MHSEKQEMRRKEENLNIVDEKGEKNNGRRKMALIKKGEKWRW